MTSPQANDHHVKMIVVHPEENNTEHMNNLSTLLAVQQGKDLHLQWLNRMRAHKPAYPCSESPVSPLQSAYHHLQNDLFFTSNNSSSFKSWSSGEQGSPCDEGHIHFVCAPDLQKSAKSENRGGHSSPLNNGGVDLASTSTLPHIAFRDNDNGLECSLPRPVNIVINGKQSNHFEKFHTLSKQQYALTEAGNELASSLSPRQLRNESKPSTPFCNARIPSADAPIQQIALGDGADFFEDSINKLQTSPSPRSPSPGSLLHVRHPPRSQLVTQWLSSHTPLASPTANNAPNLMDTSSALRASLGKAHHIQQQIDVSSGKLEYAAQRLPALELAMEPLVSDSADMRALCQFIDQTTGPALAVLEAFITVEKLAPVIKAGPASKEGVGMYLEQVSSLESSLKFLHGNSVHVVQFLHGAVEMLGRSRTIDKLSLFKFKEILYTIQSDTGFHHDQPSFGMELLECATAHLESQFAHIVSKDALIIQLQCTTSDSPPQDVALFPEASLQVLQAIAKKLSSYGRLNQCLWVYEKAREASIRKSLKTLGVSARYLRHSLPEDIQALPWETLEEHISTWLHQIEMVIETLLCPERKLISQVFDQCSDSKSHLQWQACFARLALKGALQHWLKFGVAVAQSDKEPQKLFKLLDMFECIERIGPIVEEDVLSGEACKRAQQLMVKLRRELVKGACEVLRGFGAQVEGDKDAVAPPNGGVMKLASYVVNYVKCLVGESYRSLIERVMQEEARDSDQLKAAMLHIMQALERNLEAKAKGLRASHPALGQLFLMNNHWYIYTRCKNTELAMILGTPWLKQHKQRAEKCAMRYRQEAWGVLLSLLSGPNSLPLSLGSSGVSRGLLQQRILEFEDAFVELYQLHQSWSVPDPLLRPQLGITILHSFVLKLSSLLGQLLPFSLPAVQVAYTPQCIQKMIVALFEIPEANLKQSIPQLARAPSKLRSFH